METNLIQHHTEDAAMRKNCRGEEYEILRDPFGRTFFEVHLSRAVLRT
jgi:hypothetical protein